MKAVILDRDGVINHDSDTFIKSPQEWQPIDGSLQAIARLTRHGYRIFVATNQSGLARGLLTNQTLDAIHARMRQEVKAAGGEIERIFFCPHGPDDDCDCRKPRPGLLQQIEDYCGISVSGLPCVGDSLRDLQAAAAKNCRPMLVLTGNGKHTQQQLADQVVPVYADLAAAAEAIILETI